MTLAVSVIVPTFQRRTSVARLLAALGHQTSGADSFEAIVCVDGSSDGTAELLRSVATPFRLQVLEKPNGGRASALNTGIRKAKGEIVVLLDDDMEPVPQFVQAHIDAHRGDGEVGIMGAVPIRVPSNASKAQRYTANKFNGHLERLASSDYTMLLTDFYSGNFSLRHETLLRVGCFDEDFRAYGNEDLEFSMRLRKAGISIRYEPTAIAQQSNDKDFVALARDSYSEGRTAVQLVGKHPEAFDGLRLGSFSGGSIVLRAVRNSLLFLSKRWRTLPDAIAAVERALNRVPFGEMRAFYRLSAGFFYWLGVRDALTVAGDAPASPSLKQLAAELSA